MHVIENNWQPLAARTSPAREYSRRIFTSGVSLRFQPCPLNNGSIHILGYKANLFTLTISNWAPRPNTPDCRTALPIDNITTMHRWERVNYGQPQDIRSKRYIHGPWAHGKCEWLSNHMTRQVIFEHDRQTSVFFPASHLHPNTRHFSGSDPKYCMCLDSPGLFTLSSSCPSLRVLYSTAACSHV